MGQVGCPRSDKPRTFGGICISRWFLRMDLVWLKVVRAANLIAADKNGTSDPYVVVKMGSSNKFKTDKIEDTLNPEWIEATTEFSLPRLQLSADTAVTFEVFDWVRYCTCTYTCTRANTRTRTRTHMLTHIHIHTTHTTHNTHNTHNTTSLSSFSPTLPHPS